MCMQGGGGGLLESWRALKKKESVPGLPSFSLTSFPALSISVACLWLLELN